MHALAVDCWDRPDVAVAVNKLCPVCAHQYLFTPTVEDRRYLSGYDVCDRHRRTPTVAYIGVRRQAPNPAYNCHIPPNNRAARRPDDVASPQMVKPPCSQE